MKYFRCKCGNRKFRIRTITRDKPEIVSIQCDECNAIYSVGTDASDAAIETEPIN